MEIRDKLIKQAHQLGAKVHGHYFKSNLKECRARNALRDGTKPSGNNARVPDKIMNNFLHALYTPRWDEGFDTLDFVSMGPSLQEFVSSMAWQFEIT